MSYAKRLDRKSKKSELSEAKAELKALDEVVVKEEKPEEKPRRGRKPKDEVTPE